MLDFSKVALIGGGSWATALVKILCENNTSVGWYVRNKVIHEHLMREGHNPNYLSSVEFDFSRLDLHTNINKITQLYDVLIVATPSFYLDNVLAPLTASLENKVIFSAVKGIVPEQKVLVGAFS
jgi:glycerol-3-phosphate dehydrogenase (NAD(P)+)